MHDVWKFVEENWWWMIWWGFPIAEWGADQFDAGIAAMAKRRRRKIAHREKMLEIDLEAKRRKMELENPAPVQPICGCEHHVAFHNRENNTCSKNIGTTKHPSQCECQGYSGPEPLSQIYADPIM